MPENKQLTTKYKVVHIATYLTCGGVVWQHMQGIVGFLITTFCKFTTGYFHEKNWKTVNIWQNYVHEFAQLCCHVFNKPQCIILLKLFINILDICIIIASECKESSGFCVGLLLERIGSGWASTFNTQLSFFAFCQCRPLCQSHQEPCMHVTDSGCRIEKSLTMSASGMSPLLLHADWYMDISSAYTGL